LAAGEWQRGFISLLDKLVEEETGPKGDADIRHHARELQKLLSARDVHPLQARLDLDAKRPLPQPEAHIPVYIAHRITAASTLPPLPPILEPALADAVFTHSAYTNVQKQKGLPVGDNYERLEFLGDAYIEIVASRILHSRFPHIEASQQAHFRENLVKNETLFKFACAYSFPDRLRHGSHLEKNKAWEKIISDTFEAYVAGVVLSDPEHGFEIVEDWLTNLWAPQLLNYQEKMIDNPAARTNLQALICAKGIKLDYREEKPMEMRDGGQQHFFVGVYLTGWGFENAWLGSGEDRAKGDAAINAANDALRR
ncbi:ribonuclease III, partial [Pleomassaria siparia CBS 279.74]